MTLTVQDFEELNRGITMDVDKIRISLYDLLVSLSSAQELVSSRLSNHHQQVAYLAFRLAEHIGLPIAQQKDIFLAGLVHDMGTLSTKEMLEIVESEPVTVHHHGFRGAHLIEGFSPLRGASGIVKFHHLPWGGGKGATYKGEAVPLASHIIHLADRTCSQVRPDRNILTQLPGILSTIRGQANDIFEPGLVDALSDLSKREYIWLDLVSRHPSKMIYKSGILDIAVLEIDDIVDLSLVFSRIIDFRSRFTARHSAGVAKTAQALAQLMGFSALECKMMLIAGYLHDLGKIAVGDAVLEKPSKLDEAEFNEMRAHTYFTYHLLEPMDQLKTINTWASFHHEKLNGTGYPFHISGDNLSLGSRIMAVADVFTAITEDRPYRQGMSFEETEKVLRKMVAANAIDGNVVDALFTDYQRIDGIRVRAQNEAAEHYELTMPA